MNDFLQRFPRQLGHWTLHGLFNALPSFIIVIFFMKVKRPETAIPAMLLAITFWILVFSVITSLKGPLAEKDHVLSRALRLGTRIRTVIACLSLVLFAGGETPAVVFVPDTWCGMAALAGYNYLGTLAGERNVSQYVEQGHFFPVFTVTLIEGFIISFLIVMISFFCVIVLQSSARRRLIAGATFR
jgi:ABC-type sugar transport system permease subunit